MLTTTGLPAFCAIFTACRIWSDAVTEPPGESTRSTMALMFLSRAAWRMAADRSSLAMPAEVLSRELLRGAVADFARRLDHGDIGACRAWLTLFT